MTTETAPAPIAVPLSRRLTAVIETGYHPATGQPLLASEACGNCAYMQERPRADGSTRSKCGLSVYRRYGPNLPTTTPACALHITRSAS